MRIKTITCHDVYNVGASLQAYALQHFLIEQGHDVEIINYKPDYLKHYRLWWVPNPKFDKPIIRTLYKLVKFPGRLFNRLTDPRKKVFDDFTRKYLIVTNREYHSCNELQMFPPEADLYIAGSDQIWNPTFQNGRDPAFFLQFGNDNVKKISYAASFSVESVSGKVFANMKLWLQIFDRVSVRETSGIKILEQMGICGQQVCDPVFLLTKEKWKEIATPLSEESPYLLLYDFDQNELLQQFALSLAKELGLKLLSVFNMNNADTILSNMGPREFVQYIQNASFVVSNSFHATAFSIIFHRDFIVCNRQEKINTRMQDLLKQLGLSSCGIDAEQLLCIKAQNIQRVDWELVDSIVDEMRTKSKKFLGC